MGSIDQPRVPAADGAPNPHGGEWVASPLTSARGSMEAAGDLDAQKAVARYTQSGYGLINGHLRGNWIQETSRDLEEVQKFINDLDGAFKNHGTTLTKDLTVYRGVREKNLVYGGLDKPDIEFRFDFSPGDVFEDKGYASTSVDNAFHRDVLIEIIIPKGTRVLSLIDSAEKEVLLPRGSRFEVISRTKKDDQVFYKVRVVENE